MKYRLLMLTGVLVALLAIDQTGASSAVPSEPIALLTFDSHDFTVGVAERLTIIPDGITISQSSPTGLYYSPVIEAPIPFNAVVPQWIATVPDSASMEVQLRTAKSLDEWSEWYDIHEQIDWMLPGEPDVVGEMITVPAADITHNYVQYSISLGHYEGTVAPTLEEFRLTFIDSTDGPTLDEMLEQQRLLDEEKTAEGVADFAGATDSYPRPPVISREVWCTDPACDYSSGLYYEPASHMVIHHTVSSNSSSDWPAVVRAIWNFHYRPVSQGGRGWGDVGYNYLADRTGILYEGHNNADFENLDVIGTHAAAANKGGMGVALIGTFTTPAEYSVFDVPPQPMLDAVAELLAWKADQRDIDVFDASRMPNTSWGLPHLMGHRDVYGGTNTTCPGGNAYGLLPWLRNRTAELIGFTSPHTYIDELSSAFTMSDPGIYWWEGPKGCGNSGHSYYTYSVTNPGSSTNWGEWRPDVVSSGRYEIEVYAPYCDIGGPETLGASYEIYHAQGVDDVTVNHQANVGLWMTLGNFDLQAGNSNVVRLTDLTSTDSGRAVWFDAIRIRQLPPMATNVLPTASAWFNALQVDFDWDITSPANVATTRLQVATDPGFSNVIVDQSWSGAVYSFSHTFSQDYGALYWRVILTATFGTEVTSVPTQFGLDSQAPTATVSGIYIIHDDYFVGWSGSDALSGVAGFHVDYQKDGESTWTRWLTDTDLTGSFFTSPDPGATFWFRAQAKDVAGNTGPTSAPKNTDQAILLQHAIMLPIVTRS